MSYSSSSWAQMRKLKEVKSRVQRSGTRESSLWNLEFPKPRSCTSVHTASWVGQSWVCVSLSAPSTPKIQLPTRIHAGVSFPPLFPASLQPQLTTQHSLTTCGEIIPALTLKHPPRTEDSALHSWMGWSSEPGCLGGFEGSVKSVSSMGPAGVCGLWHQIDPR